MPSDLQEGLRGGGRQSCGRSRQQRAPIQLLEPLPPTGRQKMVSGSFAWCPQRACLHQSRGPSSTRAQPRQTSWTPARPVRDRAHTGHAGLHTLWRRRSLSARGETRSSKPGPLLQGGGPGRSVWAGFWPDIAERLGCCPPVAFRTLPCRQQAHQQTLASPPNWRGAAHAVLAPHSEQSSVKLPVHPRCSQARRPRSVAPFFSLPLNERSVNYI